MLAIKTVLAQRDEIPTLIFDEIDTGISGRTAQSVAEKLALISRFHQIICITHLPQIAAMADAHYLIEKSVENRTTVSKIRCLSNEESIGELARMLGGVEITDKRIKNLGAFDLDNLNWNKVIICTDADVDGYHIRTLVLTMLYRLVPTLIDEGYVYIAESPLYEINCKEKTYFAYTELEKNGILKEIGDQKCSINRSKGLGENDPDMMWLTTMNPETRRLIKVEPEDVTKMETMFNLLLGNDEAGRKRHISEHGKEYLDQLDLQ